MFETARHRGSVGRFAGGSSTITLLRRFALAGALLSAACWLPVASAGALYRCTGSGGETVFSSSAAGYHGCKKLSTFGASSPRKAAVPRVSLARASGDVSTSARSPGADGGTVVSLSRVQGGAQTTGTAGQTTATRASLARVQARVATTGKATSTAPGAAAPLPGQWMYR